MHEYQILARLKQTTIKSNRGNWYANCQICNEKYSQQCIEASTIAYNKSRDNMVFILCKDCFTVVNDLCSKFVYNNIVYQFETSYHINDRPIKMKMKIRKKNANHYVRIPFITGNKIMY